MSVELRRGGCKGSTSRESQSAGLGSADSAWTPMMRGVLLGHLVRQLHEPPEVVQRLPAARWIDGGYDLVALASARTISASVVAIPITMLITVRPRLLVIPPGQA